jgi:large conductance mechanosensitive channel
MLKEFRDFLLRGNIVEIAVAFVMGLAFAAVVNSLARPEKRGPRRRAPFSRF